ncbi:MAG: DNA polymerase III subunit beta [Holosporales bacterium]|jgi:DNA polymerase-3 subunit beta|nr:DNA polymerase III subunit beta [Holosporales bacterium]
MKLTINQKLLEKSLAHANWVIEKRQAVPIMGYVLFEAEEGIGIRISASNMDMTIVESLKSEVSESGAYCLSAGLLYDITRKLPAEAEIHIQFDKENNSVLLRSKSATFTLYYMERDSFPPRGNDEYLVSFTMNEKILKNAIDVAKVAMLQDNTRFHLNGIHIHYENELGNNKLRFVATDLFRISCVSIDSSAETQKMPPIIISKRAAAELLKLIDDSSEKSVHVSVSENRICFKITAEDETITEFSSRLINGSFPEYRGALEVSNDKILIVDNKALINALDRVSTVVTSTSSSVKLNIQQNKITLTGMSRELGTAVEELEVSFNAFDSFEICFNSRYLLEILKQIETPQVKMLFAESTSSTLIQPTDAREKPYLDMIFAIMPIEIVND